jgi:dolichol-phosphate mannosyltransferase
LVDPDVARDFVYVDDVVEAYLLAASVHTPEWGPIYNVGTAVQTTLREVVAVARQAMNISAEPVWSSMPNRQWDASVWVSDNRKIRAQLNWQPQRTFAEGFHLMLDWFRQGPLPAYVHKASEKAAS